MGVGKPSKSSINTDSRTLPPPPTPPTKSHLTRTRAGSTQRGEPYSMDRSGLGRKAIKQGRRNLDTRISEVKTTGQKIHH